MGQKKRKAYDPFTRLRIFEKLTSLRAIYPAMSWESIAWSISDFGNIEFDRKYIQRLVPGPIPDIRVKVIVDWITKFHDPEFIEKLESEGRLLWDPSATKYLVASHNVWQPVSHQDLSTLLSRIRMQGLPEGYLSMCSAEFRTLSFLARARLLKLSPLRSKAFSLQPIYLVQIDRRLVHVEGRHPEITSLLRAEGISINHHNILDYIDFYFEMVDANQKFHIVSSQTDLIYYFMLEGAETFEIASMSVEKLDKLIEPPIVEVIDDEKYNVRVDAITDGRYSRLVFAVSDLSVNLLRRTDLQEVTVSDTTPEDITSIIDARVERDLSPLFEVLSESQRGRGLLKSAQLGAAQYACVRSASSSFDYDAESNTIIVSMNPSSNVSLGYEAVGLAYSLRFADQHLLKLDLPDPNHDVVQYATVAHGKNLDALVWTCWVAAELQAGHHASGAMVYIRRKGLKALYDAVLRGADKYQLFDIYKKT